jgi:hypothetical protein
MRKWSPWVIFGLAVFAVAVVAGSAAVYTDHESHSGPEATHDAARQLQSVSSLRDLPSSGGAISCVHCAPLAPDLGTYPDGQSLIAALVASGPLNNEEPPAVAAGDAPARSICADILANREPTAGVVVHEVRAAVEGDHGGVLFVLRQAGGTEEARLYSTGDADPTGACRLIFASPL